MDGRSQIGGKKMVDVVQIMACPGRRNLHMKSLRAPSSPFFGSIS